MIDAAVLKLSNALGDTEYHPGAPSAKGGGHKFASYEDIIEAGTKAILGMQERITELDRHVEVLMQNLHWEAELVEEVEAQVKVLKEDMERMC